VLGNQVIKVELMARPVVRVVISGIDKVACGKRDFVATLFMQPRVAEVGTEAPIVPSEVKNAIGIVRPCGGTYSRL
jgi:hypothetical protein